MIYAALVVAVLAVSAAAPLIHAAAPAPALTVAAGRIALAAVLLALLSGRRLGVWATIRRRDRGLIVLAGVLLAAHFGAWISSLYMTSTAASVALVATQPIFAATAARVFLRESLRGREIVGIAVATLGCVALAGGDLGHREAFGGDLLALVGAGTAAAYLVVGRSMRAKLDLLPYLAFVNIVAGAVLLVAAFIVGAPFVGFAPSVYLAIGVCALLPSVVGHTLLNWSVRRVPAHIVALAILGEPIGAASLTWLIHGEVPPGHAVLGGAVILAGIGVGFTGRRSG